jgi:hypothetical protein
MAKRQPPLSPFQSVKASQIYPKSWGAKKGIKLLITLNKFKQAYQFTLVRSYYMKQELASTDINMLRFFALLYKIDKRNKREQQENN